ncbi:synaptotagmin-10-like [Ptychodera flava]|uniref:synaptotagmin-10-like n=1 Tax=Ptychodera flava TaxID=63121 RepID=UPI003969ED42
MTVILGIVVGVCVCVVVVTAYGFRRKSGEGSLPFYEDVSCCACCHGCCRDGTEPEHPNKLLVTQSSQEFYIPKEKVKIQPPNKNANPPSPAASNAGSDSEQGSVSSESTNGLFESEIGSVKPDLYAKSNDIVVMQNEKQGKVKKLGKLHFKLKYDFDKSDLNVDVLQAENLPKMDFGGSSDPYVKVFLIPDEDRKLRQTQVQRRTLNPVWNETFKFPTTYDELQTKTLYFTVYDFDKFSRHDVIGEVKVILREIDVSREVDVWCDLQPCTVKQAELGDLLFSLSYLPTAERLTVVIMKARNLKAMDINGSSDPYVKVSLLQSGKRIKRRKLQCARTIEILCGTKALVFNIPTESLKHTSLEVTVVDYDLLGHSEIIGKCDVGPHFDGTGVEHWNDMLQAQRKPTAMWHTLRE